MTRLLALLALTALSAGAAAAQSSLVVTNRTGVAAYYFYASPCSSSGWGTDRLGSDVISAGASYTFSLSPGCWDFKVRFSDGDELTESRQQVNRGASITWTLGDSGGSSQPARFSGNNSNNSNNSNSGNSSSGSFVVNNRTGQSLMYLYASACSRNDWGDDQLGSDTVQAGTSYTFTITPGCWDFKARFSDGQETIQRRQRIRSGGSLRWTIN